MLTVHLLYEQTPESTAWDAPYVAELESRQTSFAFKYRRV